MYTIYRNFYNFPYNAIKPLLKKAMDKKSKTRRKVVFGSSSTPSKRFQCELSTKHRFVRYIKNKLERKGLMEGLVMKECHLLHSEKGCPRQKLHYDFNPDTIPNLAVKPRSVLLALEDETKLIVWDKDTANRKTMLKRAIASCSTPMSCTLVLPTTSQTRACSATWTPRTLHERKPSLVSS